MDWWIPPQCYAINTTSGLSTRSSAFKDFFLQYFFHYSWSAWCGKQYSVKTWVKLEHVHMAFSNYTRWKKRHHQLIPKLSCLVISRLQSIALVCYSGKSYICCQISIDTETIKNIFTVLEQTSTDQHFKRGFFN